jgi:hypothetical protein
MVVAKARCAVDAWWMVVVGLMVSCKGWDFADKQ